MTNAPHLLQLAKLQSRNGDLREARLTAAEGLQTFSKETQFAFWLDSARIHVHCCIELDDLGAAQSVIDETIKLLSSNTLSECFQARAESLIGSWLRAQGKTDESQAYVSSAITKATNARDLETLTRALLFSAFSLSLNPKNHGQALLDLDKIDILLGELNNPEVLLTSKQLRGYIYSQKVQYDLAFSVLWDAYEIAKQHGYILVLSGILAQMARIYRDQKRDDQYKIYAELAIRGLDKNKTPRQYRAIAEVCPKGFEGSLPQYDFQIDENSRLVSERSKGVIDFKNQHILFDLALLFIKNPGERYSKEDLVSKIWGQAYDPVLHDNLIYVSIKRVRTLMEPDLESPRYILRDRKGYYFNQQSVVQFKNREETSL